MANCYTSVTEMHTELNLSLLHMHRNYHMASECHRNIYFEGRASLGHFYVPVIRQNAVQTRAEHGKLMYVPRTRTVTGSKVMSIRGLKFWNSLRYDIKLTESIDVLKRLISTSACTMFENHPT